ncbi:MAG: type II toxin-antitoxin system VapC family toxin [Candidatus Micrarchaeota archaeon]
MIVFDSYAWFEYFLEGETGDAVEKFVEDSTELIVTPALVFYEVKNKLMRENKPFQKWIDFMLARSVVEPLSAEIALSAADLRKKYRLKTSDAFIYATALHKKCKLLTGDQQLKLLPSVEVLE